MKKETKKAKAERTTAKPKTSSPKTEAPATAKERIFKEVSLATIRVNPLNPRKNFSGPKFDELLASVRAKGVIVPVLIKPVAGDGDAYEIIAGERRFRAATEAAQGNGGIKKAVIPAIVQEMTDDEAYDCMTIENLQREDLTPLEEARAFKAYLKRKGPEALQELADRIGINPCYIRRRTAVLGLPENILKAWEDGEISHGHLEQLVRVNDPKELKELYGMVVNQDMSVKHLKQQIEMRTPKLSSALFDKEATGCSKCPKNTDIQRSLFGEDVATKALCLDQVCYGNNQREWIEANWVKYRSSHKLDTNGYRFDVGIKHDDYHWMNDHDAKEKCKMCEHYLSIIGMDGNVSYKAACFGPKKCNDALFHPESDAAKKKTDPNAPRVSWHGEFFREEFFKTRIPELANALPHDDDRILRVLLLSVLESHDDAGLAFGQKLDPKNLVRNKYSDTVSYSVHENAWAVIEKLDAPMLKARLQQAALLILMNGRTTTAATRRTVAAHLGSDLATEWRMTAEYLGKKTTKELHAIAEKFGIFKEDKAKVYLFETLGGKRDRFDLCKKTQLVNIILESGVDLARKVPDEILN
jgi:ParB family transcriptional regulator, chromosome partitioning protein